MAKSVFPRYPAPWLTERGWRHFGDKKTPNGFTEAKWWDHPNHQNGNRGMFTQTAAVRHQMAVDSYGHCDCVPREEPR